MVCRPAESFGPANQISTQSLALILAGASGRVASASRRRQIASGGMLTKWRSTSLLACDSTMSCVGSFGRSVGWTAATKPTKSGFNSSIFFFSEEKQEVEAQASTAATIIVFPLILL